MVSFQDPAISWLGCQPRRLAALVASLTLLAAAAPPAAAQDAGTVVVEENNDLRTVDLATGEKSDLLVGPEIDATPSYSPDGTRVLFSSDRGELFNLWAMPAAGGTPSPVRDDTPDISGSGSQPAMRPDGEELAFVCGCGQINGIRPDGSGERVIFDPDPGEFGGPDRIGSLLNARIDWKPDGSRLAFAISPGGGGNDNQIWTVGPNGELPQQLTAGVGTLGDFDPAWSPDGTRIAFLFDRKVAVMGADGSDPQVISQSPLGGNGVTWTPDGERVVFVRSFDGQADLASVAATGTGERRITADAAAERNPWTRPALADADGDALLDSWETDGLDVDGDGTADLDLPGMGADPQHKDVFVELDFMAGHRIGQPEIDAVVEAFEAAPVANPDGEPGITLHVDNGADSVMDPRTGEEWGSASDQESVSHQDVLGSDFSADGVSFYDWTEFTAIREARFLGVRRPAFHYAVAAHSGPDQRFAGIARGTPAADFVIAMHENCASGVVPLEDECPPDADFLAATFMHELGHTLGLRHGGGDDAAFKPNYLSIMNYNFGFGLVLADGSFALDYSRFDIPLDERVLDEQEGFGIDDGPLAGFRTIFRCQGTGAKRTITLVSQAVDWDCNGSIFGSGTVQTDVSNDGATGELQGAIDWDRIVFAGGGIGALAEPPPPASSVIDEPTPTELIENRQLLEEAAAGPPAVDPPAAAPPPGVPPPAGPGPLGLDTAAPQTRIARRARINRSRRSARFSFFSSEPNSTFLCKLDRRRFTRCRSPKTYRRLRAGRHTFRVKARDAAGNTDRTPAIKRFRIERR